MRTAAVAFLGCLVCAAMLTAQGISVTTTNFGNGVIVTQTTPVGQPGQVPPRDNNTPPAKPGTGVIRGRVFAADTGLPLRRAQVRLNMQITGPLPPGQPPPIRSATSDADGRYEFKELVAGRYNLQAQKGNYVATQYGLDSQTQLSKPIDLIDGQTVERIDVSLPRGGVITGRVIDEAGEPTAEVQVSAMRFQFVNGQRRLFPNGRIATTNDIGEFRLFGITPGDYFLQATQRLVNLVDTSPTVDRSGYAPTYFPGTTDAASAQRISIGVGQTLRDVIIPLTSIRTVSVSGTAVTADNRPLNGIVMVTPEGTLPGLNMTPAQIRPDGSFVVNGMSPGTYTLQINGRESGNAEVVVGTDDITGVRIVAYPPSTVKGRVIVDPAAAQTLQVGILRVTAQPVTLNLLGGGFPPTSVKDDLTFETQSQAGLMRFQVNPLPPGWAVKAVRYRGIDVTDTGMDVKPNEPLEGLEIELTNRTATISGAVTNSRGEPTPAAWVIVFPRDRALWSTPGRYVRGLRADQQSRFNARTLPAGDYLAVALATVEVGQWQDPEFLTRIERLGSRVTVGDGDTATIDLKVTAVPQ